MTNTIFIIVAAIFPVFCLVFSGILLITSIVNRKNNSFPLAYIIVMSTNGIVISLFISLHVMIYLVLSEETYAVYLVKFGRETTLGGTFSYLNYLMVNLLMTINRVVVVAKPFNETFTHTRVFLFCGIIAVLMLISLLIPYWSPCYIVFNVSKLAFVSACAPGRHPITLFQNQYFILIPFICCFANLGIVFHVRFRRNHSYDKIMRLFKTKTRPVVSNVSTVLQNDNMSRIQTRRDYIMMRQTIIVSIYLAIYEIGGFLVRLFPNAFMSLPQDARDAYFFLRFLSIPLMNFVIYYVQTSSTRRMIRKFLNMKEQSPDTVLNTIPVDQRLSTTTQTQSRTISQVS
ncbi:hypothetical protein GCK72_025491 [Caenorhabditis remanei]|uniref:G-protein coupled receptors family 1 profile domain-containing protein n=1 Tax=Caenorhabditis remanei TaxID=31234 RepID=A0A6A5G310_CAERE|nr:hypothetical protein GCK72_025491 [Caenorhabditis remanei]KAF1749024.1 hypothetical protein GCK72_025491 [Caenorhabditis remanei]